MEASPENIQRCRHLAVISKCLERIADHAKNIAEDAVMLHEAKDIRHAGVRVILCPGKTTSESWWSMTSRMSSSWSFSISRKKPTKWPSRTPATRPSRWPVRPAQPVDPRPDAARHQRARNLPSCSSAIPRRATSPSSCSPPAPPRRIASRGLELGAHDYVTKPFSPRELVLRVKNLLRLTDAKSRTPGVEFIEAGPFRLDTVRHQATVDGQALNITATEFRLLCLLASRPGEVQPRETLLRDVWGYEPTLDTRTVDTTMQRLRTKLGQAADHLETVRGVGYRLIDVNE